MLKRRKLLRVTWRICILATTNVRCIKMVVLEFNNVYCCEISTTDGRDQYTISKVTFGEIITIGLVKIYRFDNLGMFRNWKFADNRLYRLIYVPIMIINQISISIIIKIKRYRFMTFVIIENRVINKYIELITIKRYISFNTGSVIILIKYMD